MPQPLESSLISPAEEAKHPYVLAQMLELLAGQLRDCPPALRYTLTVGTRHDDNVHGEVLEIKATGTPQ